jgi:hypothetical protein
MLNNSTSIVSETCSNKHLGKIIPIRKKLNIPPDGLNNGRFLDIELLPEDQDQAGKARQLIRLDVELQARDLSGQPFVLSKFYNLLGRGLEIMNEHLKDWSGLDLITKTDDELDTSSFAGQPVTVTVKNRRQGKQWQTAIESFHPAGTPALSA